jgi:hypothetical protein
MSIWFVVLPGVFFYLGLIVALLTGRVPVVVMFTKLHYATRRENPYFYWFFTALLLAICLYLTGRLAEETIPGFVMPAFLH